MWDQSNQHIYVAGHRGYPDKYPENTLPSFRAAIDAGVDMVEMDIRLTADHELAVIHDATLDRTSDGEGLVKEKTFKEIRALDAGLYMGEAFAGTRIPSFEEVLDAMKAYPALLFNFEIKEYPRDGNEARAYETADRALKLIEAYGMVSRCVINAFDASLLEYIDKTNGGQYKLHGYYPSEFLHVTSRDRDPYTYLYCACPFDKPRIAASYDWLWARGIQPWAGAWVRDEPGVREAAGYGTPLITCNNPEAILAILRGMGRHP